METLEQVAGEFIESLKGCHGARKWQKVNRKIGRLVKDASRWRLLRLIYRNLLLVEEDKAYAVSRTLRQRIEREIAITPSLDHARLACQMLVDARRLGRENDIAAKLAQTQGWADILSALEDALRNESPLECAMAAELIVESGLEGHPVTECPFVKQVWGWLEQTHHPLAWLPPVWQDVERRLLRTYDHGDAFAESGDGSETAGVMEDETLMDVRPEALREDATHELDKVFTKVSARYGLFSIPRIAKPTLGLACSVARHFGPLQDQATSDDLADVRCISPDLAIADVFSIAIYGGAFRERVEPCYGRLAGWRALSAFVGVPSTSSFREVEKAVGNSKWIGCNRRSSVR